MVESTFSLLITAVVIVLFMGGVALFDTFEKLINENEQLKQENQQLRKVKKYEHNSASFTKGHTKETNVRFILKHCEQKQIEALRTHDEKLLREWVKEARLARRELAALYRAKEKHDVERERDRKTF